MFSWLHSQNKIPPPKVCVMVRLSMYSSAAALPFKLEGGICVLPAYDMEILGGNLCRSTEEMFLSVGARIGYFQGDVKKLVDDIGTLRPTLFIGTPYITSNEVVAILPRLGTELRQGEKGLGDSWKK